MKLLRFTVAAMAIELEQNNIRVRLPK